MKDTFSFWMRRNLKDAYSGLITQDIDFVFISKQKEFFFFVEEKNSTKARISPAQKVIFKLFNDYLCRKENPKFLGTHLLVVTNENQAKHRLSILIDKINNNQVSIPIYDIENDVLNKLWDCKGEPLLKKTEEERSQYRGSVIKNILSLSGILNNFSFIDQIHWIFVNYCTGNFIFLEELTKNSNINEKRKEFITIIDNIFKDSNSKAINPKSKVKYNYLGYYILKFSNTNPDNSDHIFLNYNEISVDFLIKTLNLDNNYFIYEYLTKTSGL